MKRRPTLSILTNELNLLLQDEDLTDDKLREASESLLPSIADSLNSLQQTWKDKSITVKISCIILRIIGFPFFACLSFIGAIVLWLKYMKNYIKYGGEAVTYTSQMNRKSIVDVYDALHHVINEAKK